MQRYFVSKNNDEFILSKLDEHHIVDVMRNKVNDKVIFVYDNKEYLMNILSIKPLKFSMLSISTPDVELNKKVTLFFTLAKGDKIDLVLQKATELGVFRIVLLNSERCVVKFSKEDFARKLDRYNLICKEASEQSRRVNIPVVVGVYDINNIPNELLCDINYVAYEAEAGLSSQLKEIENANSISILVGPEGGISPKEFENLKNQNFIPISLGKRILRTETAAITALSVIDYVVER